VGRSIELEVAGEGETREVKIHDGKKLTSWDGGREKNIFQEDLDAGVPGGFREIFPLSELILKRDIGKLEGQSSTGSSSRREKHEGSDGKLF